MKYLTTGLLLFLLAPTVNAGSIVNGGQSCEAITPNQARRFEWRAEAMYNRDPSEWRAAADHAVEAEYLFHELRILEWEAHAVILRMAVAGQSGTDSLVTGLEPSISSLLRECGGDRDEYIWLFALARLSLSTSYFAHDDHDLAS